MLFNDTRTTKIYTYLHTLSLHDALPIFTVTFRADGVVGGVPFSDSWNWEQAGDSVFHSSSTHCPNEIRSEEHTSELKSLMRNSYAVFCLKKKHKLNTNHLHYIN